jgi:hypothetical protein
MVKRWVKEGKGEGKGVGGMKGDTLVVHTVEERRRLNGARDDIIEGKSAGASLGCEDAVIGVLGFYGGVAGV